MLLDRRQNHSQSRHHPTAISSRGHAFVTMTLLILFLKSERPTNWLRGYSRHFQTEHLRVLDKGFRLLTPATSNEKIEGEWDVFRDDLEVRHVHLIRFTIHVPFQDYVPNSLQLTSKHVDGDACVAIVGIIQLLQDPFRNQVH